jgi:hypothetical protein
MPVIGWDGTETHLHLVDVFAAVQILSPTAAITTVWHRASGEAPFKTIQVPVPGSEFPSLDRCNPGLVFRFHHYFECQPHVPRPPCYRLALRTGLLRVLRNLGLPSTLTPLRGYSLAVHSRRHASRPNRPIPHGFALVIHLLGLDHRLCEVDLPIRFACSPSVRFTPSPVPCILRAYFKYVFFNLLLDRVSI